MLLHPAESVTLVSQVMSILSPTLIVSSNDGSATRRLYRQFVRTGDADRSSGLVDIGDSHGHCSDHGRRATGFHVLPHGGGPAHIDRRPARRAASVFAETVLLYVADT